MKIIAIPAFSDNYIWALINPDNQKLVVVDPGESDAVKAFITQHKLELCAILITHHHYDHTGGVADLKTQFNCRVYGPNNPKISGIDHYLQDQDTFKIAELDKEFTIFSTPGHTLDHICYYSLGYLFCGDTLFSAGCGRLFEGTSKQMYHSLAKLQALPKDTKIYCAHEYTLDNLRFAASIGFNKNAVLQKIAKIEGQLACKQASLPSILADEHQYNVFLMCNNPDFQDHIAHKFQKNCQNDPIATFTIVRQMKDQF